MNAPDISEEATPKNEQPSEIRLKARAVSRGVAIGKIVCLHGNNRQFYRVDIKASSVKSEIRRLHTAVNLAKRQLSKIVSRKKGRISDSGPGIFESHRMLIEDSSLQSKFEKEISEQKINAEWAIKLVTDSYVARYKAIEDEHLRDRYIDIEDVSERILAALGGGQAKISFAKDAIIAAKELKPSTLVELSDDNPLAVITENGGWTSHTFILASVGEYGVNIRAFDIGPETIHVECFAAVTESRSWILRSIRLTLAEPELLVTQLRAILRANVRGNISIVIPMISGVDGRSVGLERF